MKSIYKNSSFSENTIRSTMYNLFKSENEFAENVGATHIESTTIKRFQITYNLQFPMNEKIVILGNLPDYTSIIT